MKINFKKGFTLIELLVVIAIIGLLSSVVLASLNSARAKSRDGARVQTVSQVKNALELYYDENKHYPIYSGTNSSPISSLITGNLTNYLKTLTTNFQVTGGAAPMYYTDSTGSYYELTIPTETGGAFSRNVGCSATTYNGMSGTSKYCYGNNAVGAASGGGGSGNGGSSPTLTLTANPQSDPKSFTWSTTGITGSNPCTISSDVMTEAFGGYNPAPSAGTAYLAPLSENGVWAYDGQEFTQVTVSMQCTSSGQSTPTQSVTIYSDGN
jgi:prepilin-type N-terminal cleavage/methylation domain-containing protein